MKIHTLKYNEKPEFMEILLNVKLQIAKGSLSYEIVNEGFSLELKSLPNTQLLQDDIDKEFLDDLTPQNQNFNNPLNLKELFDNQGKKFGSRIDGIEEQFKKHAEENSKLFEQFREFLNKQGEGKEGENGKE